MNLPPRNPVRDERGFTIVEIIVAVVIVTMVLGGVIWMIAGAGKAQQRADVRQKMAAAADGLAQQVRSNKDWLEKLPQCKLRECDLKEFGSKYQYQPVKSNDPKFQSIVKVTPIDSPLDTIPNPPAGAKPEEVDRDHIIPDLYRIAVTIILPPEEQKVWGVQQPFNFVSTVDATQIGKGTGTLTVQACVVDNQVDERMAIAGCKNKAQQLEMRYQPPCKNDEVLNPLEVERRVFAGQTFSLSCNAAIAEAKGIKADGFAPGSVDIKPMKDVKFTVKPKKGGVFERDQTLADAVSGDGAAWTYTGLGTGTYEIDLKHLPLNLELWESHEVPENLVVSIQNNQEAKAMIVLRPKQGVANPTANYVVQLMRNVYVYTLQMDTRVMFNETPDPVHLAAVHSTTTYKYLRFVLTSVEPRTGPSWNGYLAMEPKPFDRYREKGTRTNRQFVKRVGWKAEPMVDDPTDGTVIFSAPTLSPMPTGLYSRPEQLQVQQSGYYGSLDKEIFFRGARMTSPKFYNPKNGEPFNLFGKLHLNEGKMICTGVPCGNDYVYLDKNGQPTSKMLFYDMAEGECYIQSAVPEVPIIRQLSGGGEQDGTGLPGQDRCERDFLVNGVPIFNMIPDRNGMDGKTVLWRSKMDQVCVPADQCVPIFDIDRTMLPNPGTVVPTESGFLPTPLRTDMSTPIFCSDAQKAAMVVSGGGSCPPPASIPVLSVLPPLGMIPSPGSVASGEDKQAVAACKDYMKVYENNINNVGLTPEQLSSNGFEALDCEPICPSGGASGEKPYANQPMRIYAGTEDSNFQAWSGASADSFGAFNKKGTTMCPPPMPGVSVPYFMPPIAPPVEPPVFTGPNPDAPGTIGLPVGGIPGITPMVAGGMSTANGIDGTPRPSVCFTGDTKVLMASGAYKAIRDIEVGELVMTGNPKTGAKQVRKVTKTWKRPSDDILVDVFTKHGKFTSTAYHPIWNATENMWWGAFDLAGKHLVSSDGDKSMVMRTLTHKEPTDVYNITVGGTDAFFVKTGDSDVLVRAQEPNGELSYNPPGT